MKKTIAAWTIAAAAVLGLAGCTGAPGSSAGGTSAPASSTPSAAAPASDQSVADGCAAVQSKIQDATAAISDIDMSQAMSDPQGTVDSVSATVDAVGSAADSVSNNEVKTAVSNLYDDAVALRDLLSKVLIDGDMTATAGISGAAADAQSSAQELATICG